MTHPFATRTILLRAVRDRPVVFAAERGIRHKTVWLRWYPPGNFSDEQFLQQSIDSSGIYPTVPELSKSEFLVKGCKPDSATHVTKNMIANRRMAVFVDGKKGICRSKTLRETDSRKVSSARFKSLLHDGAELIDTLIDV